MRSFQLLHSVGEKHMSFLISLNIFTFGPTWKYTETSNFDRSIG